MLTQNKFSFHLDFFFNWKKKKMSRQWRQKHIFLFIQIVQEMSRNFKSVAVCFSFFICKKKKLVVKIKTSRFFCKNFEFSGQFFLFLVSFYRPLTVVLIPGSLHLANYLFAKMIFLEYFLDFMNCFFDTSNERSYNARCNMACTLLSILNLNASCLYVILHLVWAPCCSPVDMPHHKSMRSSFP